MSQSTATLLATIVVYKLSSALKRLHILWWLTCFQLGILLVVTVWPPGNHDQPIFFIVPAIYGLVEGGLTGMIAGKTEYIIQINSQGLLIRTFNPTQNIYIGRKGKTN